MLRYPFQGKKGYNDKNDTGETSLFLKGSFC